MPATPAEMQALRGARHLIAVMTPDLASIRDTDRLRQLAAGLGTSHTTIVLNRVGMPGSLKLPLIEQGLGEKPAIQIPELGKQLGRAANLGKPALGECASFRTAIAQLAQELSGAAPAECRVAAVDHCLAGYSADETIRSPSGGGSHLSRGRCKAAAFARRRGSDGHGAAASPACKDYGTTRFGRHRRDDRPRSCGQNWNP